MHGILGWLIGLLVVTLIVVVPLVLYTIRQSRKYGDKMFAKKKNKATPDQQ